MGGVAARCGGGDVAPVSSDTEVDRPGHRSALWPVTGEQPGGFVEGARDGLDATPNPSVPDGHNYLLGHQSVAQTRQVASPTPSIFGHIFENPGMNRSDLVFYRGKSPCSRF